ncbi:MAG: type II toxin-antitoxin system Phd/YefM family antitoxin [Candidatus Cloacimonetes bacterium]|nr:type II toxin-antitoxin system Phd/YefM family antitoxin [Candidatus Cloacimonadota bacterium]MCF7813859.1 type II toxin-antitoxin system Phd/YefM family antitoxin [Candidatus Cloacimonadota bacterium]MCF7868297.1 type II toxin-antitoxin system Phd/YefM family antitoxin [Candidatus Cloacimonadota bacterium]MCF7883729.1 type II toxin-antitoxin system Phd/YefM family antitoxin [Candidatus Cloacimonadota bacterium]
MKYSEAIKPISYLKANAAKILKEISKTRSPLIITQNGEAKAVLQDIKEYEEMKETLALLKILALGEESVRKGEVKSADEVFSEIEKKIENDQK